MGSIFFTYGETIISPISSQGIHYKVNLLRIICTKKDNSSKKEYGHKLSNTVIQPALVIFGIDECILILVITFLEQFAT